MYRTEIGVKVYEHGDVVSIRTGKTEYTVQGSTEERGELVILSNNIGKSGNRLTKVIENEGDLNLVTNIRDTDEWKAANEAAKTHDLGSGKDDMVQETSAYAKAILFALNRLQKHVYAGTVRKNVKAKRRSLGRRQKASRKANR